MTLQIIGAGLGRTGTASTKIALEKLGFNKCYHMGEVIADPDRMAGWLEAARGNPNWDAIFKGYAACVDYPAAAFWRPLAEHYPDAKVLLNVRPAEKWFESVNETILNPEWCEAGRGTPHFEFLDETIYVTMDRRMHDREHMIEHFNRHVAEVKATIPADRLLVFDVKDGWAPLCAFLNVPVPDEPFPRVNSRDETRQMLEMLKNSRDWGADDTLQSAAKKMFEH